MRAATLTVTHTIVFCLSKPFTVTHTMVCQNPSLPQVRQLPARHTAVQVQRWPAGLPRTSRMVHIMASSTFFFLLYPHLFSKVRANLTIRNLHFTNLGASLYCKAVACCDGGDACERSLAKKNSTRLNLQHRTANVNMHLQPHAQ